MPSAAKAKREAAKAAKASSKPPKKDNAAENPQSSTTSQVQLVFPSSLTARQRAAIHAVGEQYNLPHTSTGEGDTRTITLGSSEAPVFNLSTQGAPVDPGVSPDDALLIELIQKHLHIDASAAFTERGKTASNGANTKSSSIKFSSILSISINPSLAYGSGS